MMMLLMCVEVINALMVDLCFLMFDNRFAIV
jgi:hypothetical protein